MSQKNKDVQVELKHIADNEFECNGLVSPGEAKEMLGYGVVGSVYKAIDREDLRFVKFSKEHSSRRLMIFKKDVEDLKKELIKKARDRQKKLDKK